MSTNKSHDIIVEPFVTDEILGLASMYMIAQNPKAFISCYGEYMKKKKRITEEVDLNKKANKLGLFRTN